MSLNINGIGNVTITATKGGNPGSFEKINSVTLSDPTAGVPAISEDGLSCTVQWGSEPKTGVTLTVDIDNLVGAGGSLTATSGPFDIVDGVLADAATVTVS